MKTLVLGVLVLAILNVPVLALDNSKDILKDQEIIEGNVIYTGVFNDTAQNIGIDTTVNQIVI